MGLAERPIRTAGNRCGLAAGWGLRSTWRNRGWLNPCPSWVLLIYPHYRPWLFCYSLAVQAARILFVSLYCLLSVSCNAREATPLSKESALVAPLIDPGKLATLGKRGANPRVQKAVAILWTAEHDGADPAKVAEDAVFRIGWADTAKGKLTVAALLRNLTIVERLGSVTPADIVAMSHGRAPTVRKGPYAGDIVSVDHIVPRAVVPELDNVIANLEFMPLKLNESKNDRVGERQVDVARKLHAAGLLGDSGLQRVLAAAGR